MSLAQWMHFLKDVFQMTANAFAFMINHYHIIGLQLLMGCSYFETPVI